MKLLHFADSHVQAGRYGPIDRQTGLHVRSLDFIRRLEDIGLIADLHQVDAIIGAGDTFHQRDPSVSYLWAVARIVNWWVDRNRLAEPRNAILVDGNHESHVDQSLRSATALLDTEVTSNTYIEIAHHPVVLAYPKFTVACLPWIHPQNLKEPIEEILEKLATNASLAAEGLPIILVAHCAVEGAVYGDYREATLGGDFVVTLDQLRAGPWSYVALGHIHRHQVLWEDPPIIYSGSTERLDFGEEHENKGVMLVEFEGTQVSSYQFMPLEARRYVTWEVRPDVPSAVPDFTDAVARAIVAEGADASPHNLRAIEQELAQAFFSQGVIVKRTQRERARLDVPAQSLRPDELLWKWAVSKGLAVEQRQDLQRALSEVSK